MASEQTKDILRQLRGAELKVPNMKPLYRNWASGISPHYEYMVGFTNDIYETLLSNPDELKKAKACDFGYTSAGWFPSSDLDRLKFMAKFCAWIFNWDDATDREDISLETGNQYRAQALECIEHQLGLGRKKRQNGTTNGTKGHRNGYTNGHGTKSELEPESLTPQLELFASLGKSIRETSDDNMAKLFFHELQYMFDCCGKEQKNKLSGDLPTIEQYWEMRYGTSGVTTYCAIAPYMINVNIPSELFQSVEMKAVWLEMNVNIIIFNDIISLKKEVADDEIVSLIPVIMAEENVGLAEATDILYEKLVASCKAFDQAVVALRQRTEGYDETTQSILDRLITCYEAFLTGVMNWSYTTARYKAAQDIREDGSLLVTL